MARLLVTQSIADRLRCAAYWEEQKSEHALAEKILAEWIARREEERGKVYGYPPRGKGR